MYLTFGLDILFNQNLLITFKTQDMRNITFSFFSKEAHFQKLWYQSWVVKFRLDNSI